MSGQPPRAMLPVLGALSAFGAASLDMYLPALPTIGADFGVAPERIQATIGAFLMGFAGGMLFYGPLSDRFGRRPALAAGIALYVVASLGCALATDIQTFIWLRFVQALGGGAAMALARAMVRDLYATDQGARVMSLMMLVTALMPLVAPSIGGLVLGALGWRAIFWVLAVFGATTLAALYLLVPETLPPDRRRPFNPLAVARAYGEILVDPRALCFLLAGGAAFGGLMAYVTGTPYVYIVYFGVAPQHFGLLFALGAMAIGSGNAVNAVLVTRRGFLPMMRVGAGVAGFGGFLLLAEAVFGPPSLMQLLATLMLYLLCINMAATNAVAGLMALYPRQAGAASALFGATQFGLGALFSRLLGHIDDGTPRALCLIVGVAGCISVSAALIQAVFFRTPQKI